MAVRSSNVLLEYLCSQSWPIWYLSRAMKSTLPYILTLYFYTIIHKDLIKVTWYRVENVLLFILRYLPNWFGFFFVWNNIICLENIIMQSIFSSWYTFPLVTRPLNLFQCCGEVVLKRDLYDKGIWISNKIG